MQVLIAIEKVNKRIEVTQSLDLSLKLCMFGYVCSVTSGVRCFSAISLDLCESAHKMHKELLERNKFVFNEFMFVLIRVTFV